MSSAPPRGGSFDGDSKDEKFAVEHIDHVDADGRPAADDTKFGGGAITDDVYHFGEMSEDEIEKRRKALVRLIDLRCVDRSNLANARLGSLEEDLGMTGNDFQTATSILFVGYLIFQLPSNMLLTKIKPSIMLPTAMLLWGLVSLLTAWAQNYSGLLAVRFVLGVVEAPFFPGAMFVLSSWYTRAELGARYAWFYAGAALANSFNGLLSAVVLDSLDGNMGIAGWRWLYIIEGALTMGIALVGYWLLPNYPKTTKWLSEEQRQYAAWRLAMDVGSDDTAGELGLMDSIKAAVCDPKLYLFMVLQHLILLSQCFQYVFPSVVKTLGYNKTITSLLTAPPWFAAFLAGIAVTMSAAKTGQRAYYIVGAMFFSAVGNMMTTFGTSLGVRYTGMLFMCCGVLSAFQISLTWISNSFARPTGKRAACIAIVNLTGNSANTYGSQAYPLADGPAYRIGCLLMFAVSLIVVILALVIRVILARQNRALDRDQGIAVAGDSKTATDASEESGATTTATDPALRGFRFLL